MSFKYFCPDCGKQFFSLLPSWKCPECEGRTFSHDNIAAFEEEIASLKAEISVKDKLLAKAEAKMKAMQMDKEQLESDIINARMNLEHLRKLYEERADLCEQQDRQLLELDFILANYPYMVHFGNGTMCTENHKEYERLLASISANAVNEVLNELKNTLVINNEGNTEIFDYVYTLETIEEFKNKGGDIQCVVYRGLVKAKERIITKNYTTNSLLYVTGLIGTCNDI